MGLSFLLFFSIFLCFFLTKSWTFGKIQDIDNVPKVSRRLSDVVMVLIPRQVDAVIDVMDKWTRFPPCESSLVSSDINKIGRSSDLLRTNHYPETPLGRNINLTFVLSGSSDKFDCKSCKDRLFKKYASLPLSIRSCFSSVSYKYLSLKPENDTYLRGSLAMFTAILRNEIGLYNPEYVLQMEADVSPIRSNWLEALDAVTREPNESAWIIGSSYRSGAIRKEYRSMIHMNGNAIYNVGEEDFRLFFDNTLLPWMRKNFNHDRPYDTFMALYLIYNNDDEIVSLIMSKLRFTDVLHNCPHRPLRASQIRTSFPGAFLVHDRNLILD